MSKLISIHNTNLGDIKALLLPSGVMVVIDSNIASRLTNLRIPCSLLFFDESIGFVWINDKFGLRTNKGVNNIVNNNFNRFVIALSNKGFKGVFKRFSAEGFIVNKRVLESLIDLINLELVNLTDDEIIRVFNGDVSFNNTNDLKAFFNKNNLTINEGVFNKIKQSLGRVGESDDFYFYSKSFPLLIINADNSFNLKNHYFIASNLKFNRFDFYYGEMINLKTNLDFRGRSISFIVITKLEDYNKINNVKSLLKKAVSDKSIIPYFNPVILRKRERSSINDLKPLLTDDFINAFLPIYYSFIKSDGWLISASKEKGVIDKFLKSFRKETVALLKRGGDINSIVLKAFINAVNKELIIIKREKSVNLGTNSFFNPLAVIKSIAVGSYNLDKIKEFVKDFESKLHSFLK